MNMRRYTMKYNERTIIKYKNPFMVMAMIYPYGNSTLIIFSLEKH